MFFSVTLIRQVLHQKCVNIELVKYNQMLRGVIQQMVWCCLFAFSLRSDCVLAAAFTLLLHWDGYIAIPSSRACMHGSAVAMLCHTTEWHCPVLLCRSGRSWMLSMLHNSFQQAQGGSLYTGCNSNALVYCTACKSVLYPTIVFTAPYTIYQNVVSQERKPQHWL